MKKSPLLDISKEQIKKHKKQKLSIKELKPFFRFYKNYTSSFVIGIFCILIAVALGLATPILTGNLLASFGSDFVADKTLNIAIALVCVSVFNAIYSYFVDRLWNYTIHSINIDIKTDIIQRINNIKSECFDKTNTSAFTTRLMGDAENLASLPLELMNDLSNVLSKLGFIAYAFALNWQVGLFLVGYIAIFMLIQIARDNARIQQRFNVSIAKESENSLEIENIKGMRDIRGLNTTNSVLEQTVNKIKYTRSWEFRMSKYNNALNSVSKAAVAIMDFLFVVLCIFLILDGQIALSLFMIVYNFKSSIHGFAYIILGIRTVIYNCAFCGKRINDLYDENQFPTEKFGDVTLENVVGKVTFDNVSFAYDKNLPVLKNLSFEIPANSLVSFVGHSGAGKSTIISLLNKLYTLEEGNGKILLDDTDINTLNRESLRNNICIVSQNPYIFDMTIAENLRLAKSDATNEELEDALKQAELLDFINTLPKKLDSKVGENGIVLSGGQKQRVAIARALLKNAKVIVFDEATSALDNQNQSKIKRIIKKLSKNHTIIMVAHRLSTVVDSDKIIFIKDGSAFKEGTHEQLMNTCPDYSDLYKEEISRID